nr:FimV/HubP family polar landmark protein [Methylicorpusculum oleiharenae]
MTRTLALVSLLTPTSALPLGLGEIKLHSALNQNLNAEIALQLSGDENASDIQVKLASPDKFDEAGLSWAGFLSKIRFDLITKPNGAVVVRLTSSEALREPFLDFLLQVTWPKGSIYREFTVLVDPPATYQQAVVPVFSAPVSRRESSARSAEDYEYTPRPRRPSKPADPNVYGPVGRSDTLWTVASKINRAKEASVEQVMMALFEANPQAFFKDNVNALTAGTRLKIPSKDVILKLSRQDAIAEFQKHNQAWKSGLSRQSVEVEKPVQEAVENELKLVAPTAVDVADTDNVVSGNQEDGSVKDSVSPSSATGLAATQDKAQSDLQVRMEKLEQQLAVMQQLLALKDEQLAALQNKEKASETQPVTVEPNKIGEPVVVIPTPSQPQPVPIAKPAPVKPKPLPVKAPEPETSFFSDYYYELLTLLGLGVLGGVGWYGLRKRQSQAEEEIHSMFAASSEISLPDLEEQLNVPSIEDASNYDVGTVGESSFLSEFTPSDFDAFDTDQHEVDPISEADVYLAYGRYQQAEELIRHAISDAPDNNVLKLKLLEIFYANENKEAFEHYVSELKRSSKQEDKDFWAKVNEMASEISPGNGIPASGLASKNEVPEDLDFGTDFTSELEALAAMEQDDVPVSQVETKEEDAYDFDLPVFDKTDLKTPHTLKDENVTDGDDGLDFDFNLSEFENIDSISVAKKSQDKTEIQDNSIEFDFTAINDSSESDSTKDDAPYAADIESFDFDFSVPEFDSSDTKSPAPNGEDKLPPELNFDLSVLPDFSKKESPEVPSAVNLSEDGASNENEEFDFNFNFDFDEDKKPEKVNDDSSVSLDLDFGVSDLTDMDEFETKIDLARAYIDMGDAEAAMGLANEVVLNGNPEQKKQAQAILDKLG